MPAVHQVDGDQIERAAIALQQFFTKQQHEQPNSNLFADEASDVISIQIALKKIPDASRSKLRSIALPNSLRQDEHVEMCLFVKDDAKAAIKASLAEHPVAGLTKIMTLKKLKSHFRQFEDKRKLVASFDLFLADDRILPCLAKPLGKTFFAKKKQPSAVTVARRGVQVSGQALAQTLEAARDATHFRISTGPCFSIRAALTNMTSSQIRDNVDVILTQVMAHIPRGWKNVQAVYMKTTDSVALPVYTSLPGGVLKIPQPQREPEEEGEAREESRVVVGGTVETPMKEQHAKVDEPQKKIKKNMTMTSTPTMKKKRKTMKD